MKHCVIRRVRPTNSKLTVMRSTDESFEENYGAPRELACQLGYSNPDPAYAKRILPGKEMLRR